VALLGAVLASVSTLLVDIVISLAEVVRSNER
jgi:hypothetical protein